jgi:uncharacterized protein
MKPPACLSEREGALWLQVKAQPRARRNEISGLLGSELKVKITAPPVDSAANEALVEYLAATLNCPRRAVTLVRGQASAHKVFRLEGIALSQAANALGF